MKREARNSNPLEKITPLDDKIPLLVPRLKKEGRLALISINTQSLLEFQDTFDRSMYQTILFAVQSCLARLCGSEIRKDDIIASNITNGKKYYIFLSRAREIKQAEVGDLERIAFRIQEFIYNRLFETFYPLTRRGPQVKVGYSVCFHSPQLDEKSIIQNLIEESEQIAAYMELKYGLVRKVLLHDILHGDGSSVFFQPLIELKTLKVMGYEAIVSGPEGTTLGNSFNLSNYARESGFEKELEWASGRRIIARAIGLSSERMLFLKTNTSALCDSKGKVEEFLALLDESGLDPARIIFELNSRTPARQGDLFYAPRLCYPKANVLLDVDGTWTEEDGMPDCFERIRFLRVGVDVVRDIHLNASNQKIFTCFQESAHRRSMRVIANGIHCREEMEKLIELGADIGQGLFLGKPEQEFAEPAGTSENMEDRVLQRKLLLSIYLKRGREYFSRADYDKAVLEFSKVIEIDSVNKESYYHRGYAYCEDGVFAIALKDLAKLREIDAEFPLSWLLEGRIAEKQGDKKRAIDCYEEYIGRAVQSYDADISFAQTRIKACRSR